MSNRAISDTSIRASSKRDNQHRAHHGRLGGNSYWCSAANKAKSYIEIDLPRIYKITKATIDVQESNNVRGVEIFSQILQKWLKIYHEPVNTIYTAKTLKLSEDINFMKFNWSSKFKEKIQLFAFAFLFYFIFLLFYFSYLFFLTGTGTG